MPSKEFLSALSGAIFAFAFVPYIISMIRGKTKPVKASWITWSLVDTITLVGMIVAGAQYGMILGVVIGAWIVTLITFKYGKPGWSWIDKLALLGVAFGLFLWWVLQDPLAGIATSLVIVLIGSVPTIVSAWEDPTRENTLAWTIMLVSCIIGLLAIPGYPSQWKLADAGQPTVFFVIEVFVVFILYFRPGMLQRMRKRLEFVQRELIAVEEENKTLEEVVRNVTATAVDGGTNHEQARRKRRWQDIEYNNAIVRRLKQEKEKLQRKLGIS